MASIRENVLQRVVEIQADRPMRSERRLTEVSVPLNDEAIRFVLMDEQAKMPIHALLSLADKNDLQQLLTILCQSKALRLRFNLSESAVPESWSEVFQVRNSIEPWNAKDLLDATRQMTIWGPGRVNINSIEPGTLSHLVDRIIDRKAGQKVLERVTNGATIQTLDSLIGPLGLNLTDKRKLDKLLDVRSSTYSVWIFPESRPAELHVVESEGEGSATVTSFIW
jgi:hypothetical protein